MSKTTITIQIDEDDKKMLLQFCKEKDITLEDYFNMFVKEFTTPQNFPFFIERLNFKQSFSDR